MSKQIYIIPIFVPHKGCPNDCVFCNQRRITGQNNEFNFEKVKNTIEEHLTTINLSNNTHVEIAFYGGSFTGIDLENQKKFLEIAYRYINKYDLYGIRLSTRPDYIDDKILKLLKEYNVKTIELGVQSLNNEVLKLSNRGHDTSSVYKSSTLIKKYGFKLGIQLMPGLPGDNFKRIKYTTDEVINIKPDFVRIYPTLVIKDTKLAEMYKNNEYNPLNLDDAVDISAYMYKRFIENNINVIRIGLQPTENIMEGKDVIAGPFHSSFRQLVVSKYIYIQISEALKKENINQLDEIEFIVNNKDISFLIGNKKVNRIRLNKNFGIKKVKLNIADKIKRGKIKMNFNNSQKTIIFK